uniref:Immunoglobulin domain-containing protein n=1 Tax=Bos mutus grunniens TaxID=30521 RepID=A0A8B9Y0T4_BOSMU
MRGSATTLTFTALLCLGVYRAPSLSAQPSPVVAAGGRVSLICSSQYAAGSLHLLKEGGADPLRHKTSRSYGNQGREQAVFPVGPVTTSHGGTYRCYDAPSIQPYLWSRPSDPLHLQVTGEAPRGRDTGILGQDVGGNNLTLQCRSEAGRSDTFHLSKEGSLAAPQHLRLQDPAPPVQANFTLRAVTSAHSGTYRCYSSHSTAPHLLSIPSDPLELQVSDYTVQNLIRMGLAASVLLLLGILLCQARHDRGGARDVTQS